MNLLALAAVLVLPVWSAPIPIPPGIRLALPQGVELRWVVPPSSRAPEEPGEFAIDPGGQPWLGFEGRVLFNPAAPSVFRVVPGFNGFTWLPSGEFVMASGCAVGGVGPGDVFRFEASFRVPDDICRLYGSTGSGIYLMGSVSGGTRLYLIEAGADGPHAKRLFDVQTGIHAVAGDGKTTYFAVARRVVRMNGAVAEPYFEHPSELIKDLALTKSGVLYFATDTAAGYLSADKPVELLMGAGIRLAARGDDVMIRLAESSAILEIKGAGRLK